MFDLALVKALHEQLLLSREVRQEVCGVVLHPSLGWPRIQVLRNLSETPRKDFAFDVGPVLEFAQATYHSHVDTDAVLSSADALVMMRSKVDMVILSAKTGRMRWFREDGQTFRVADEYHYKEEPHITDPHQSK